MVLEDYGWPYFLSSTKEGQGPLLWTSIAINISSFGWNLEVYNLN